MASTKSYTLPAADVRVRVVSDGSLLVEENITFQFDRPFEGAYRDIPLRTGESIHRVSVREGSTVYRPGGDTKLGSTDEAGKFGVERSFRRVRIVWHYRASDERRTFTIRYRLRGLAVAYDDVVDVDLNVWGSHWPVGVDDLRAAITLPRPARLGRSYRVYGHPAWVHGVVTRTPRAALLHAVGVPAKQFVEQRVVFPRSLLASTAGAKQRAGNGLAAIVAEEHADQASIAQDQAQIDDAKRHIGRTLLYLLLLGLGPALFLTAATWLLCGRERKTDYDRDYEQQPPSDTEPALVPPLLRQSGTPGSFEFTSTLFDLIRRGRYSSKPVTTDRKLWGGLRHEDVADLELSLGDESVRLNGVRGAGRERLQRGRRARAGATLEHA